MTYVPKQAGFRELQDSAGFLRVVFPNYPELQPCNPVPAVPSPGGSISRVGLCAVMKKTSILASSCETTRLSVRVRAGRQSVILNKNRSEI